MVKLLSKVRSNWITIKEVEDAAHTGELEALIVSLEQWNQIALCTKQEYERAVKRKKIGMNKDFCALCIRYFRKNKCTCCPIDQKKGENCHMAHSTYQKVIFAVTRADPEDSLDAPTLPMRDLLRQLIWEETTGGII